MHPGRITVLLASRPGASLVAGYASVAALLSALVAMQSGVGSALPAFFANLLILSPAMGIAWLLGRMLAQRAPQTQAWWMTRAQGHVAAFIGAVVVAAVPLLAVMEQASVQPDLSPLSHEELAVGLLGAVVFVNATPLGVALLVEAAARWRLGRARRAG